MSNDRAVSHGGDAVSSDDSAKSEKIFIDTRRFANRVQAVALTASQFTGTFGDVKLETLDVTIKHLVFVESSQPADSVKIPWNERTLISVNPLFNNGLKREPPKPRTPALDEPTALKDAEKETPTVLIDKGSNFVVLFKLSRASFEASATGAAPKKGDAPRGTRARRDFDIFARFRKRTRREKASRPKRGRDDVDVTPIDPSKTRPRPKPQARRRTRARAACCPSGTSRACWASRCRGRVTRSRTPCSSP